MSGDSVRSGVDKEEAWREKRADGWSWQMPADTEKAPVGSPELADGGNTSRGRMSTCLFVHSQIGEE